MQDVVGAGVLVLEQHLLEGPAAVGRAEDAALGVRAVRMTEDRDEEPVGVAGIDGDGRDHLAVAQPEMLPRASGVGGLVDPVADRQIGTDDARAGADVDDVGVRRRDGDRADRAGRLVVEQRHPVGAVVGRSPDAAVVEAGVEHVRLAGDAGQRAGASGASRADVAPAHLAEREVLGGGGRRADAGERDSKGGENQKGAHEREYAMRAFLPARRRESRVLRSAVPQNTNRRPICNLAAGAVDALARDLAEVGARQVHVRLVPDDRVERVVGLDARFERGTSTPIVNDLGQRHVVTNDARTVQPVVEPRVAARRERVLHREHRWCRTTRSRVGLSSVGSPSTT